MNRNLRSLALALCLAALAVGVAAGSPLNRKISGDLPDYADVESYWNVQISPDSRYAVYASDERVDDFYELYSVPLDGSSGPVRISGPTQVSGVFSSREWKITPDSRRVVYRDWDSILGSAPLFSVAIEGGQKVRLDPILPSYNYVEEFTISPDGAKVVLGTKQGMFSVPVEGGKATLLTRDSYSSNIRITADSETVAYMRSDPAFSSAELYSIPIDGGAVITITNKLSRLAEWQLYEDGAGVQRVAFIAASDDGSYGLYTAPATGGDVERIPVSSTEANPRFFICADGDTVIFRAGEYPGNRTISSVSLTAKVPIKLAVSTTATGYGALAANPDCSSVVYDEDNSLFVVGVSGGNPVRISYLCSATFTFSSDSKYMVYQGREELGQPCEVRALDFTTKSSVRVNTPLAAGGSVGWGASLITPDSQAVLYVAEQDSSNVAELFMASFDGADNVKLSGPMTFGGNVTGSPVLSPDGRYVVYVADQERDEVHELFATALEGGSEARTYLPLVQR